MTQHSLSLQQQSFVLSLWQQELSDRQHGRAAVHPGGPSDRSGCQTLLAPFEQQLGPRRGFLCSLKERARNGGQAPVAANGMQRLPQCGIFD
jgi:hypothetical protein